MMIDRQNPPSSPVQPMVSVAITAYNSAQWLSRALDSVLAQQTSFPVEIVIGDDCSQDSTLEVALNYRSRHPSRIRIIARMANAGIQRNYYETFEACTGKYIAWLDADDYWTDPAKLALQVEVMEADPTIQLSGHYIRVVSSDGIVKQERSPSFPPGSYGMDEILRSCTVPSVSAVFRNGLQRELPAAYFDLAPVTEWPIWVLAALHGRIEMLDRVMADYMHTPGSSAWSKGNLFAHIKEAEFFDKIEDVVPPVWRRRVRAEKGKRYEAQAYWLRQQGDYLGSRHAALKAFLSPSPADNLASKTKSLLAATFHEAKWRCSGKTRNTSA
ncbi:MAG TPA: glycosyltransferase [Acidobacteriaceae bacterium]|nr:glycosyltransferase [Acidobacteriaceae bacterium]